MDVVMAVADEMQLMEDKKEEEGSKSGKNEFAKCFHHW